MDGSEIDGLKRKRIAFTVPNDGTGSEPSDNFGAIDPSFSGGTGGDSNDDRDFDPTIHVGRDRRNADGSYRRKRGRRAGSGGGRGKRKAPVNPSSIEALQRALVIIHAGLSGLTKTPELELEQDDARNLAEASANLLNEFEIKPDPKIEATIAFVVVAGSIYAPKLAMIRMRRQEEKVNKGGVILGTHNLG